MTFFFVVFTLSWWSGTKWAMSKSTYTAEMMKFQGKGQGPTLELSLPVTGPRKCPCLGLGSFSSHRKASHSATWKVTHPVARPSLGRLAPRPRGPRDFNSLGRPAVIQAGGSPVCSPNNNQPHSLPGDPMLIPAGNHGSVICLPSLAPSR